MKITDEYIIKLFYTKNGLGPLNCQLRRKAADPCKTIVSKDIDDNIRKYLNSRYSDSKSLNETLFRIKHGIEHRPHCSTPGCTNEVAFNGTTKKPYMLHCCCSCTQKDKEVRDKNRNTCLSLYGVENGGQSQQAKDKYAQKMENKYGPGISNAWQAEEVKEKSKQSLIDRFGVDNIAKSQYSKDKHKLCEKETVAKRNATKKKNGTFNTSKPENDCYDLLVSEFGQKNVFRQYSSALYPFQCDFYIKPLGLYIEYNGSWTHGGHQFDATNEVDLSIVEKWKAKNTKYYDIAIHTWTIRDVNKRNTAKQNNLNWIEFWKVDELEEFLKDLHK